MQTIFKWILGSMGFVLLSTHPAAADEQTFTRLASDPVSQNSRSTGCAWGDFNNDGYIDLVTSAFQSNYRLFTNNANGTFSRADIGDINTSTGNSFGVCVADYDNDGLLDVFISRNFGLADYLFHNEGNGVLRRVTTGEITSSSANGNNCVWGDYDNDGFVDLFIANSDQRDYLFHNTGSGNFVKVVKGVIAEKNGNSQGAAWGDYDNDGWLDLVVSRVNVPNVLYHNDGDGVFTDVRSNAVVTGIVSAQGTSWGDYNNDGFLDLFIGIPGGKNLLYRNNQDGTFTKVLDSVIASDSLGLGASWADFDNDGFLDLFVPCNRVAPLLYWNRGDGTFTKSTTNGVVKEFTGGFTSCVGDIDNDGFQDLFVSFASTNMLYRNNGNLNGWITFTCEGRVSNRAAIGAKLRLESIIGGRPVQQLREISGGGALGSQNDLRASFGLGDAESVSRLRVEWPSGIKQEFSNLAPRQFRKIVEPDVRLASYHQGVPPGGSFTLETLQELPGVRWQWLFNDQILPGETNRLLTVANLQPTNFGTYTLTGISTELGSFAAKPATIAEPVSLSFPAGRFRFSHPVRAVDGQSLILSFFAVSNHTYTVEISDGSEPWTRWYEHQALTDGWVSFTNAFTAGVPRLFRALTAP